MELKQIQLFVAVADDLHFRRAAERMFIAQPALSQHIRRLEREVGAQLLDRSARHVRLTPAGDAFVGIARRMLNDAREAGEAARHAATGAVGTLAVGAMFPITGSVLPRALRAWHRQRPDVRVTLTVGRSTDLVGLVRRRALDIAIVDEVVESPSLTVVTLNEASLGVLLPRDHALSGRNLIRIGELAEESFVNVSPTTSARAHERLSLACGRAGFSPIVTTELSDPLLVAPAVASGVGIAVVSQEWADAGLSDDVVWCRLDDVDAVPLNAVHVTEGVSQQACEFLSTLSRIRRHRVSRMVGTPSTATANEVAFVDAVA
jgi:DNA-binding transcriptional LysR family regulator